MGLLVMSALYMMIICEVLRIKEVQFLMWKFTFFHVTTCISGNMQVTSGNTPANVGLPDVAQQVTHMLPEIAPANIKSVNCRTKVQFIMVPIWKASHLLCRVSFMEEG